MRRAFFGAILPRSFYLRPTLDIARDLPGRILVHRSPKGTLAGRIVEVEAYLGSADPAAHTYHGRTDRNASMFLRGGHLYVYFTYGMHFCANVVTEEAGIGHACLIRAVEPILGVEEMQRRRKTERVTALTSGPAKLCQAFSISRRHNGLDLLHSPITLHAGVPAAPHEIETTVRIGIAQGKALPYRFVVRGSAYTSRTR
jgi:DNA-3-methyladenine glycosylase